ncbi:MAG: CoA-binding protein [Pseudomonadota bacterium]
MGTEPIEQDRKSELSQFFEPQGIAVFGSFKEGIFGGYMVVKSLLEAGYKGRIYPVNPAYKQVLGHRVYPSVREVMEEIDLGIIMINAQAVSQVMRECGEKGLKALIVVSDGFAERDRQGARLQEEIVKISRKWGMRVIGPNTAGIVNTANGFNPCPYEAGYYRLREGCIAISSQTGMTNPQAVPYTKLNIGISKICDFGNKCDLDECDLLEYLEKDEKTEVVSMYLESIRDGRKFLEISKKVTRRKPVLIFKSGRTDEGARASASHTGSMAVDDQIFDAVCEQAGVLRLEEFNDLFEMPKIFASQPLPEGNRLGIVSYTGGVGVLAADQGGRYGFALSRLSPETSKMLDGIFPGLGKIPVDIGPPAPAIKDFFSLYPTILEAVLSDKNVDSLFNVLWADTTGKSFKTYIKGYRELRGRYRKPLATWIYGPNIPLVEELTQALEGMGFPVFSGPEKAIKALGLALKYSQIKKKKVS